MRRRKKEKKRRRRSLHGNCMCVCVCVCVRFYFNFQRAFFLEAIYSVAAGFVAEGIRGWWVNFSYRGGGGGVVR